MKYQGYIVGPIIRKLRKDRRITVDFLSGMTGLSTSSINQIEQGGRNLSMSSLFLLMDAFDCDANTILHIEKKTEGTIELRLRKLNPERREYLTRTFDFMLEQAEQVKE